MQSVKRMKKEPEVNQREEMGIPKDRKADWLAISQQRKKSDDYIIEIQPETNEESKWNSMKASDVFEFKKLHDHHQQENDDDAVSVASTLSQGDSNSNQYEVSTVKENIVQRGRLSKRVIKRRQFYKDQKKKRSLGKKKRWREKRHRMKLVDEESVQLNVEVAVGNNQPSIDFLVGLNEDVSAKTRQACIQHGLSDKMYTKIKTYIESNVTKWKKQHQGKTFRKSIASPKSTTEELTSQEIVEEYQFNAFQRRKTSTGQSNALQNQQYPISSLPILSYKAKPFVPALHHSKSYLPLPHVTPSHTISPENATQYEPQAAFEEAPTFNINVQQKAQTSIHPEAKVHERAINQNISLQVEEQMNANTKTTELRITEPLPKEEDIVASVHQELARMDLTISEAIAKAIPIQQPKPRKWTIGQQVQMEALEAKAEAKLLEERKQNQAMALLAMDLESIRLIELYHLRKKLPRRRVRW